MEHTIYDIALDLQKSGMGGTLIVKKGDTHRRLRLRLLDRGRPYPLAEDCYAVFTAQKPDGTVIYNPCTRDGNNLIYDLTPQTTAVAGVLDCEVKLYGPEDALLTSAAFTVTVEDTVYTQGEEAVTSTGEASALTQLITQARETISEVENEMEIIIANEANHAIIDDTKAGSDAWSAKNIADKLCLAFTESGAVVQCQPVEGYPLAVVSTIDPKEDGTTWSEIKLTNCGKNFLKFPYYYDSQTVNGITFTVNDDGTVTANGTSTATAQFYLARDSITDGLFLPKGTFTVSGCPAGGGHATYRIKAIGNSYGLDAYDIGSGAKGSTKETSSCTGVVIQIMKAGVTLDNVVFKPQIEMGSVATEYEPYKGETYTADLTGEGITEGTYNWEAAAHPGVNILFSDCGDTTVTGRADPSAVIEKLTNAIIALGGNV